MICTDFRAICERGQGTPSEVIAACRHLGECWACWDYSQSLEYPYMTQAEYDERMAMLAAAAREDPEVLGGQGWPEWLEACHERV